MAEISIRAEELFRIGPWPITNSVLLAVLAFGVLVLLGIFLSRTLKPVPGTLQGFAELLIDGALSLMSSVLGSRERSERYLPLVATIFLFILTANWLGLLPFIGPIGIRNPGGGFTPFFRSPAADLNFTVALAVISVAATNVLAVRAVGFGRHAGKFFTLQSPIAAFTGLLEFVSELVKIVSFSFRLFGNVFAGEVLLGITGALVPYLMPLPFLALEVFVGFIQAFIFAMLTLVAIAMGTGADLAHWAGATEHRSGDAHHQTRINSLKGRPA